MNGLQNPDTIQKQTQNQTEPRSKEHKGKAGHR